MDAHHEMDAIVKLFIIFLGGEVWQIGGQEGKVAVQTGLKAQLLYQLLFSFVETGEKEKKALRKELIFCI